MSIPNKPMSGFEKFDITKVSPFFIIAFFKSNKIIDLSNFSRFRPITRFT